MYTVVGYDYLCIVHIGKADKSALCSVAIVVVDKDSTGVDSVTGVIQVNTVSGNVADGVVVIDGKSYSVSEATSGVVISRFIGTRDSEKTSKAVHTSIVFALICGVSIALLGEALIAPLLKLTYVLSELMADAALYLRIYFAGMPLYMLYNFTASVFRSAGKTQIPLYCLTAGGALNVALNVLFVMVFSMKVEGVAIATVIANGFSFILLILALRRERDDIRFSVRKCRMDKSIVFSIVKIGLPSGLLGSVFSVSNLCVQSAVNSLGSKVILASSSASNIEIYVQYVGNAFAQAGATFISQNLGAKDHDRCKRTALTALSVCVSATLVIAV